MTRTGWDLTDPSPGFSTFSSMLTGMLPISSSPLLTIESILVDYAPDPTATLVLITANHSTSAIDPYVVVRPDHLGGERDREVDHGANRHVRLDLKKHTICGNISCLCVRAAGFRLHGNRQFDGEAGRALNISEAIPLCFHVRPLPRFN